MRVHQNFVEQLPMMLTILVLSGLFLPKLTMFVGFLLVGGRAIYAIMYIKRGPAGRRLGAFLGNLPMNILFLSAFVTACIKLSN